MTERFRSQAIRSFDDTERAATRRLVSVESVESVAETERADVTATKVFGLSER